MYGAARGALCGTEALLSWAALCTALIKVYFKFSLDLESRHKYKNQVGSTNVKTMPGLSKIGLTQQAAPVTTRVLKIPQWTGFL